MSIKHLVIGCFEGVFALGQVYVLVSRVTDPQNFVLVGVPPKNLLEDIAVALLGQGVDVDKYFEDVFWRHTDEHEVLWIRHTRDEDIDLSQRKHAFKTADHQMLNRQRLRSEMGGANVLIRNATRVPKVKLTEGTVRKCQAIHMTPDPFRNIEGAPVLCGPSVRKLAQRNVAT